MSLATDIKEVYTELGASITIIRDNGNISGEYIMYERNAQATKPFIREYFLEADFPYDSSAVTGDVIEIDTTDSLYMLMNKSPDIFENSIVEHGSVLYKVNTSGEVWRPSGETRNPQTYKMELNWESVKSNAYALLTEPEFGEELSLEDEKPSIGWLPDKKKELFIPASYGVKELDRIEPTSGEFYMVESVKPRRYPDIDLCILGEDTR